MFQSYSKKLVKKKSTPSIQHPYFGWTSKSDYLLRNDPNAIKYLEMFLIITRWTSIINFLT